MQHIKWAENRFKGRGQHMKSAELYSAERLEKVNDFHASMPGYEQTPLYELKNLSELLRVGSIYVKDEYENFGLNAFTGLGISYAFAEYFSRKLYINLDDFT